MFNIIEEVIKNKNLLVIVTFRVVCTSYILHKSDLQYWTRPSELPSLQGNKHPPIKATTGKKGLTMVNIMSGSLEGTITTN